MMGLKWAIIEESELARGPNSRQFGQDVSK